MAIFAQPLQESLPPRVNPAALLLFYASSSSGRGGAEGARGTALAHSLASGLSAQPAGRTCHASSSNTSGAARQKMPLRRMEGDFLGEPLPRWRGCGPRATPPAPISGQFFQ